MRIAYYNATLGETWGAGVHGRALVRCWRDAGHEVLCLPREMPDAPIATASGFGRYRWLPTPLRRVGQDVRARLRAGMAGNVLRAEMRRFEPDVFIARRVPFDYTLDSIWCTTDLLCVAEVNAVLAWEFSTLGWDVHPPREVARERRYLRCANLAICVTDTVRRTVVEAGVPESRTVTIENGVDTRAFAPGGRMSDEVRVWRQGLGGVFAYTGSFSFTHDMIALIEACRCVAGRRDDVGFLFVGPTRTDLRRWLPPRDPLWARVLASGRVAHEEVPGLLAGADLFWTAFRHVHGSPLKLYEYLAMGRPVVLAGSGPGPDLVERIGAGRAVPAGDGARLAAAALQIWQDGSAAARLGAAGRAWVEDNATWEAVAARMIEGVVGASRSGDALPGDAITHNPEPGMEP